MTPQGIKAELAEQPAAGPCAAPPCSIAQVAVGGAAAHTRTPPTPTSQVEGRAQSALLWQGRTQRVAAASVPPHAVSPVQKVHEGTQGSPGPAWGRKALRHAPSAHSMPGAHSAVLWQGRVQ